MAKSSVSAIHLYHHFATKIDAEVTHKNARKKNIYPKAKAIVFHAGCFPDKGETTMFVPMSSRMIPAELAEEAFHGNFSFVTSEANRKILIKLCSKWRKENDDDNNKKKRISSEENWVLELGLVKH
eukprot:gene5988-4294_t